MSDFIEDAIQAADVDLDVEPLEDGRFRCKLSSTHGQMVRDIRLKDGVSAPHAGGLIYHFALQAQQFELSDDITDWAEDMGKSLSEPGVIDEYRQLDADYRDLAILLGQANFDAMLQGLAIHQAIGNARPR